MHLSNQEYEVLANFAKSDKKKLENTITLDVYNNKSKLDQEEYLVIKSSETNDIKSAVKYFINFFLYFLIFNFNCIVYYFSFINFPYII